jgi:hypothetical protein
MRTTDLSSMSAEERLELTQDSGIDEETQCALAADEVQRVRKWLTENENLAARAQLVLARDEDELVRRRLATHRALTPEVQLVLAEDTCSRVQWRLTRNPHVTLTDDFPVAFLELSLEGCAHLERRFECSGLDREELSALRKGWTGTLEELLETAGELSAHAA